jgi:hypothetical protein
LTKSPFYMFIHINMCDKRLNLINEGKFQEGSFVMEAVSDERNHLIR